MDPGQGFAVHLPRQHDLVGLDLAPRHADQVVHGLVLLEVRVGPVEFQVLAAAGHAAALLDDLFQAHADVPRRAVGPVGPGGVDHLVPLAGVQPDLLDATRAAALDRHELLHAREDFLVLQVGHTESPRVLDRSVHLEFPLVGVDVGDAAVVPDKVQGRRRDGLRRDEALRWLAVVGELEQVEHVGVFFLNHTEPRFFRDGGQWTADRLVPHLPTHAFEDGVGVGDGPKLEFRRRREFIVDQNLVGLRLLLRIVFPFDVPVSQFSAKTRSTDPV